MDACGAIIYGLPITEGSSVCDANIYGYETCAARDVRQSRRQLDRQREEQMTGRREYDRRRDRKYTLNHQSPP